MQFFHVLGIMIAVSFIEQTRCCTCLPLHPQQYYCSSDFVIRGTVTASEVIEANVFDSRVISFHASGSSPTFEYSYSSAGEDNIVYTVDIKKRYKGNDLTAPKTTVMIISQSVASCGSVYLAINQDLVIMGDVVNGELTIGPCGFYKRSDQITKRQLKGLKRYYKKTCNKCSICLDFECDDDSVDETDICSLAVDNYGFGSYGGGGICEIDFARCGQNKKGKCVWLGKKDYRKCKRQE